MIKQRVLWKSIKERVVIPYDALLIKLSWVKFALLISILMVTFMLAIPLERALGGESLCGYISSGADDRWYLHACGSNSIYLLDLEALGCSSDPQIGCPSQGYWTFESVAYEEIDPQARDNNWAFQATRLITWWDVSAYRRIESCRSCPANNLPPEIVEQFCGYLDWGLENIPLILDFDQSGYPLVFQTEEAAQRGYYLIRGPRLRALEPTLEFARFGKISWQIDNWDSYQLVNNCQDKQPISITPPSSAVSNNLPAPVFEYPFMNQNLAFRGDYLFKVRSVEGAQGYMWGFAQEGEFLWVNLHDEGSLSGPMYAILSGSQVSQRFSPGILDVYVQASVGGKVTETAALSVHLIEEPLDIPAPLLPESPYAEVPVPAIQQIFSPPEPADITSSGARDYGTQNCLPASTAMVLQSLELQGMISGAISDYPSVRRAFRQREPYAGASIWLGWVPEVVGELANYNLRSANVYLEPNLWQEVIYFQLSLGYPVIATVQDWSCLAAQWAGHNTHAVVIYGFDGEKVSYLDPWDGMRYEMLLGDFAKAWGYAPAGNKGYLATIFK